MDVTRSKITRRAFMCCTAFFTLFHYATARNVVGQRYNFVYNANNRNARVFVIAIPIGS